MKQSLVVCLLLLVVIWPPIYGLYVQPKLNAWIDPGTTPADELKKLLDVSRYTIHVPEDKDGWLLSFERVIDGKARTTGGSTVEGGTDHVLLIRRNQETDEIESCHYTKNGVFRLTFNDPLKGSGTSTLRTEGPIKDGDWLMLGGRKSVGFGSSGIRADCQLRLALPAAGN